MDKRERETPLTNPQQRRCGFEVVTAQAEIPDD